MMSNVQPSLANRRRFLKWLGVSSAALTASDVCAGERLTGKFISAICFTSANRLWIADESSIHELSWPDLTTLQTLALDFDQVNCLALHMEAGEKRELLVAGGTPGEAGILVAIDLESRQVSWERRAGSDVIRCLDVESESGRIAAGGHDQRVYLWSRSDSQWESEPKVMTDHSAPVTGVLWLEEGLLVTGSLDQSLRLWDTMTLQSKRTLQQHTEGIDAVVRLPHSASGLAQCLSLARDRTARLWQPTIGRMLRLARLPAACLAAIPGPNPETAWLAGQDGSVYLLDLLSVKIIEQRRLADAPLFAIAKAPDESRWIAAGGRGLVEPQKDHANSTQ